MGRRLPQQSLCAFQLAAARAPIAAPNDRVGNHRRNPDHRRLAVWTASRSTLDDLQPDFDTAHFLGGFPTEHGRFRFKVDWSSLGPYPEGLTPFPDYSAAVIDAADGEHPLRLVVPPARNYLNSSFTETPTSIAKEARPTVKIHPDTAAAQNIAEGDLVTLGNRQGWPASMPSFRDLQPDVVIVEGIWPNDAFPGGLGINVLVSADPGRPASGGVFHDTAVWLRKGFDG